ncbi:MAG: response regulator transcription factor [Lachnospiraceae bacterium]|jgi:DNA-binding response OmpR family regulator|nr:response regulator transcription factor [Lachnospiraceae bacterium]
MKKILTIDDEPEILSLIRRSLQNEYEVDTCLRPAEELPKSLDVYDLIISDVMMPGEDGYRIVERIRSEVTCPILFLTAKNMESDVIYGLSVGADDYLQKPFSVAELRARIAAHLRRENRENTKIIKEGDVWFYLDEKVINVKGEPCKLTKSEYDIALFLARNHGRIFSKEQIYEQIYGYEKEGNDTAITEHVKNLRKKLMNLSTDPIETVWGIGYKWKKEE